MVVVAIATTLLSVAGCSSDTTASVDTTASSEPNATPSNETAKAMERLSGRYAHYDVVAYQSADMKTLIISYGFTDLYVEDGELMAQESFCHAKHRSDQPIETTMSDAATRAIKPIAAVTTLTSVGGKARVQRPETPTGIGIRLEDPANEELPTDPNDPRVADDDNDGKPGVTVRIKASEELQGELYIARRERFAYEVAEGTDATLTGTLTGTVTDKSEQLIVGASNPIFITDKPWVQVEDLSKSPIILIKQTKDWDCDRLEIERDKIFPEPPVVDW